MFRYERPGSLMLILGVFCAIDYQSMSSFTDSCFGRAIAGDSSANRPTNVVKSGSTLPDGAIARFLGGKTLQLLD